MTRVPRWTAMLHGRARICGKAMWSKDIGLTDHASRRLARPLQLSPDAISIFTPLAAHLTPFEGAVRGAVREGGLVIMWKLTLDATQKALIAQLKASREVWQSSGTYEAEQYQEPPAVRQNQGAALRKVLPHAAHAPWKAPKNRPSPVDIVVAGNAGRQQHLVPLRMARMAASPFAFLRGAASVMAWDLSHTPVTGIQVIIDGDAHINNVGLFGSLQRDVIVDMNDFDEATVGPWEWDLKRLVASVNVAGRENGLSRRERRTAVMQAVNGYRANAARLSTMGVLEVWSHLRLCGPPPESGRRAEKSMGADPEGRGQGEGDHQRDAAAKGRAAAPRWRLAVHRRSSRSDGRRRRDAREDHRCAQASTPSTSRPPTATCCDAMASRTSLTASWASAASARAPIWRSSSATAITIPCSSRSRKPLYPRTRRTFRRWRRAPNTTALASLAPNASSSPSAIRCSATPRLTNGRTTSGR